MIDSTNPRQMANNIKELEKKLNALAASITPVVANPAETSSKKSTSKK